MRILKVDAYILTFCFQRVAGMLQKCPGGGNFFYAFYLCLTAGLVRITSILLSPEISLLAIISIWLNLIMGLGIINVAEYHYNKTGFNAFQITLAATIRTIMMFVIVVKIAALPLTIQILTEHAGRILLLASFFLAGATPLPKLKGEE